jgi:hypothetical protein
MRGNGGNIIAVGGGEHSSPVVVWVGRAVNVIEAGRPVGNVVAGRPVSFIFTSVS